MVRRRIALWRLTVLLVDGFAATILFLLVSRFRFGAGWEDAWAAAGAPWYVWAAAYGGLWAAAEWLQELDRARARWTMREEVLDILRAGVVASLSVFSLLFLFKAPEVSRLFLILLFVVQVLFSIVQRRVIRLALAAGRRTGLGERNVLVLGTGPDAIRMAAWLEQHPALGYRIIGHLGAPARTRLPIIGPLDEVESVIHDEVVDEVVACLAPEEAEYLEPVISLCHEEGKPLRILLQPGTPVVGGRVEILRGMEVATITNGPDRVIGMVLKRTIDIVLSAVALVLLAPVFLAAIVAIRVHDGGPAFFRQTRIGLHGREFRMVKFRSMVLDAEERKADLADLNEISGHAFKLENDPRITRIGAFLRRTSIDELPQLWNVLRGQMSIVGPRPPLADEVANYDLWHRRRLSMKPGITGLWQVSARLEEEFDRWVELDLRYIDRWSLWLDIKIMFRTVPAMLSGR